MLALALEAHERHAVAARVGDPRRRRRRRPSAAPRGSTLLEAARSQRARRSGVAGAAPPRRGRAGGRSAAAPRRRRHHDDAAVLAEVRDRLGAAAVDVEVGDRARPEHAQRPIGPFGETFTWPSPSSGALPTKNSGWRGSSRAVVVDLVVDLATARHSLRAGRGGVRCAPMPRRRAALAVLVVLAAAVAGPAVHPPGAAAAALWPSMRHDVRNTGASDVRPRVDRRASPWAFHTARGVFSTPVLDDAGDVYVGSADRSFVALSSGGRLRWRIRTGGLIDAAAVSSRVRRDLRRGRRGPARRLDGPAALGALARRADARGRPRSARALVGGQPAAGRGRHDVRREHGRRGLRAQRRRARALGAPARELGVDHLPAVGPDGTTYWGSLDLATFRSTATDARRWSAPAGGYVVASPALRRTAARSTPRPSTGRSRPSTRRPVVRWRAGRRCTLRLPGAARGRRGPRDGCGHRVDRRHDPHARARRSRTLALRHGRARALVARARARPRAPARSRRVGLYAGSGDGRLYAASTPTPAGGLVLDDTTPRPRRGP